MNLHGTAPPPLPTIFPDYEPVRLEVGLFSMTAPSKVPCSSWDFLGELI